MQSGRKKKKASYPLVLSLVYSLSSSFSAFPAQIKQCWLKKQFLKAEVNQLNNFSSGDQKYRYYN